MSAPPKQSKAESKRVRASDGPADPAATSGQAQDRSVRQRIDQTRSSGVTAGSSSVTGASLAADSSASSLSSATLIRPSLMRLAVVERQLVMQALDITSLSRLASTCSQLRAEALHREAGKLIPDPEEESALYEVRRIDRLHPAHASPLFRAHMPVRLSFNLSSGDRTTSEQQQALMAKAAGFSRITELNIGLRPWTESEALHLLAQPWVHSVHTVVLVSPSPVWLRSSAVQHALFALPQLTSIRARFEDADGCALLESALSLASKLTEARICLHAGVARMLRALRSAPSLRTVELLFQDDAPLGPFLWILPRTLTELRLSEISLEPVSMSRSALKTMLARLPLLRQLRVSYMQIAPLLQGLLDAGVSALPNLRRVDFDLGRTGGLDDDLLRRFLHKFATATVRFDYRRTLKDAKGDQVAITIARRFGAWPRVHVDLYFTNPPPAPHPSDDEAESDVELEAEPAESDEPL